MRILLAEDTRDLARAEIALLSHEGYEVTPAYDGEEALRALEDQNYDVIILDIMMPKVDGLTVLQTLRRRGLATPVLLLTAKAEIDDRVTGLDLGADDYLTKPFAMKELLARVRSLIRRQSTPDIAEYHFADLSLDAASLAMTCANTIRLSNREFELMRLLIRNQDRELSASYLISHIWASEPDASEETVWLYISYLRQKLFSISSEVRIAGKKGGSYRLLASEGVTAD